MSVIRNAFIVCEYNPFHNGHKYLIEETVKHGADSVICVMSGNFVQRGEPAVCGKFIRAEAAVRGGADLVIELPVKYAVSNASWFAYGAVDIIQNTGLGGFLSFGASADMESLSNIADIISDEQTNKIINAILLQKGCSYPAALSEYVLSKKMDSDFELLSDPNNVLAVEYIRNARKMKTGFDFMAFERAHGIMHNSEKTSDNIASAKLIRDLLSAEKEISSVERFIPPETIPLFRKSMNDCLFPVDRSKFETVAFSRLYTLIPEDFIKIDNVSHGMENRITEAIKENCSLSDLYDSIKTKRYTHSRIRQIIMSAVLGIEKKDLDAGATYIRVLAFNEKGRELLNLMRKRASLPIVTNLSDIKNNTGCQNDLIADIGAERLYNLCLPNPEKGNTAFLKHPVYVK